MTSSCFRPQTLTYTVVGTKSPRRPSLHGERDPQMFLKDHWGVCLFLGAKCPKPMLKIELMSRVIGTFFVHDP